MDPPLEVKWKVLREINIHKKFTRSLRPPLLKFLDPHLGMITILYIVRPCWIMIQCYSIGYTTVDLYNFIQINLAFNTNKSLLIMSKYSVIYNLNNHNFLDIYRFPFLNIKYQECIWNVYFDRNYSMYTAPILNYVAENSTVTLMNEIKIPYIMVHGVEMIENTTGQDIQSFWSFNFLDVEHVEIFRDMSTEYVMKPWQSIINV